MISVVSSSSTGGDFYFLMHLYANFGKKCQICVIYKNLDNNGANWLRRIKAISCRSADHKPQGTTESHKESPGFLFGFIRIKTE